LNWSYKARCARGSWRLHICTNKLVSTMQLEKVIPEVRDYLFIKLI